VSEDVRRRDLIALGSLGITASVLPSSLAAASGELGLVAAAPSTPTIASAEPAGYRLTTGDDTDGAIEVTWDEVSGATSYTVATRTPSGSGTYTVAGTTSATTLTVTGLSETATYDVVVEASNEVGASGPSAPATAVGTVVATGGTVTSFVADGSNGDDGTRYVVHTFSALGMSSLTLNRDRALEYVVVGGGGGGGGLTGRGMCGGGGGGGGVEAGDRPSTDTDVGEPLTVVVGAGGAGGPDAPLTESPDADGYARGGTSSSFDGVAALGGGAGGSAPFGSGTAETGDAAALPSPNTVSTAARATGGGGVGQATRQLGAAGSSWNGGAGTLSATAGSQFGGGGGGAGGNGTSGSGTTSGSGGVGVASSITGERVEYGSGGGGGKRDTGSGGPGGVLSGLVSAGGAGGRDAAGSAGVDGRGGGGGGAGRLSSVPSVGNAVGGSGGSGIVIVRYAIPAV
jgi:hypothetical protein